MFEVYATTPDGMNPGSIGAHAARAEAMGYDALHVPDARHDGLLLANNALLATRRLRVGTGVLVAFPRSPMVVAVAAWDLQRLSDGRFELGLGSQIRQNIEDRYATTWTAPAARMRDYIGALRAIFAAFQQGTPLDYRGDHYRFTRLQPFFNPGPIEYAAPPILLGAVGPLMTRTAGQVADGIITHPTNTAPRYLREVCLPRLHEGMDLSPARAPCRLLLGTLVATGPDDATVARERAKARRLLAFMYSTPAYWPSLRQLGWEERGRQLLQLARSADWRGMELLVDDAMLDAFVPAGTYDEIAQVLQALFGDLATGINFPLPEDPAHDALAARAIARLQGRIP